MSAAYQHVTQPQQPQIVAPPPAPVKPSKRNRGGLWLLLVLLLVGIGGFAVYQARTKSEAAKNASVVATKTAVVQAGSLDRTLRVTGQTAAVDFSTIIAPSLKGPEAREMILMFLPPAGSWVKKGALIAQVDAQALQDHVDDLGDTIEAAEADVRKRRAEQAIEWETLQQTVRIAKSDWDKAKLDFSAAEVRTDVERQLLKLTLDETEAHHRQLQSDLDQKRKAHAAEVRVLELTRERHIRHRDRHRNDLKAFTIYAPMDGLVVMQQVWRGSEMGQYQLGDRLFPGQPFMKIVNTKRMQMEGFVNQVQSGDIRIGERARVHLDAFPEVEFNAAVHSVGALAVGGPRQNYYVRTVPVMLKIEGNDPKLIPDLSASADVVLARADNKPLIPLSAVKQENGKAVVQVKNGEGFESREINLGLQSDTQAVVLAGLNVGDVILVN